MKTDTAPPDNHNKESLTPIMKKALITGQDGAYLAEFLLEKGYEVHGIKRRASSFNTKNNRGSYNFMGVPQNTNDNPHRSKKLRNRLMPPGPDQPEFSSRHKYS